MGFLVSANNNDDGDMSWPMHPHGTHHDVKDWNSNARRGILLYFEWMGSRTTGFRKNNIDTKCNSMEMDWLLFPNYRETYLLMDLQSMSSFRYYSYFHCGRFTCLVISAAGNHPNCSLAFLLDIQMQTDWKEDTLKNRKLRNHTVKALTFQVWPFLPQMKGVATSETPEFIATNPTKHTALIFNIGGVHMKNFIEY